jgi:o-succinylbenzoate synthase
VSAGLAYVAALGATAGLQLAFGVLLALGPGARMTGRAATSFAGLGTDLRHVAAALEAAGIDRAVPFRVATRTRFRGVSERRGLLLHGSTGWSEFSPFEEYPPPTARRWLDAAIEAATDPAPPAVRTHVPVNVTVPAVPAAEAAAIVRSSAARTAKVKVAEPGQDVAEDLARVAAVREALGPDGAIRLDANAGWDLASACERLPALAAAAGGLEYVEQPCAALDDLAILRARTGIAVAVDETLRLDRVEDRDALQAACDVLVLKVQPLGGIRAALALAQQVGLPAVVSSALETSVGLAVGVRLAAALPELPYACGLDTARLLDGDVTASLVSVGGTHEVARAERILRDGPGAIETERPVQDAIWRRVADVIRSASGYPQR